MDKIDFVITWVDSDDFKWRAKRSKYISNEDDLLTSDNTGIQRYRDYGTLKYLFRSIYLYAPWVNKIYLITDSQIPKWLNKSNDKVTLIDHKDIIDSKYLPSFNSNAIEWSISNINDLSEEFVLFNDDMLLNHRISPDFFFKNSLPRDFRAYRPFMPIEEFDKSIFNDIYALNLWIKKWPKTYKGIFRVRSFKPLINSLFMLTKHKISAYYDPHLPQPYLKSNFVSAKKIWHREIHKTLTHKFRSDEDVTQWLVRYYQLEQGLFEPCSKINGHFYTINDIDLLSKDLLNSKSMTLCINDKNSVNYSANVNSIKNILDTKFPYKSPFEY